MPSGNKDFNQGQNAGVSGDIASRLTLGGGAYHPTGTWILFDDFEGPTPLTKWQTVLTGGSTIAVDNTQAYRGTNCLKFTTGALVSVQAALTKVIPITSDKIGLDFMVNFVPLNGASVVGIQAYLFMNVGLNIRQYQASIGATYVGSTGLTSLTLGSDIGPNPQIASNLNISWTATRWHNMKLIYDMKNQLYVRFFFDNFVFDLTGFTPIHNGLAIQTDIGQYVSPQVLVNTAVAQAEIVRVDDVIVTYNET